MVLRPFKYIVYCSVKTDTIFFLFCVRFSFLLSSTNISSDRFRLRLALHRSNEKIEEYRHYFQLIDGRNEQTNIDDLTAIDYSDEDFPPIEKNFCLDDHSNEKNFLFARYFFDPAKIRRTFSGKTKTRCSRTLFPTARVDR